MRITCDPGKRQGTLRARGLDMRRAKEIFAGLHLTRVDDRFDYGEPTIRHRGLARLEVGRVCLDTTWVRSVDR
jgi:hypothetical protein